MPLCELIRYSLTINHHSPLNDNNLNGLGSVMFSMHRTVAAEEVIREGGAANVIDRIELLVTSGTVYGGDRSNKKQK